MYPRTLLILMVAIILTSFGVRFIVYQYDLLPINEQALLKKATSLTVTYEIQGKDKKTGQPTLRPKTLTISNPDEMEDLLAVLELRRESYRGEMDNGPMVKGRNGGMVAVDPWGREGWARGTVKVTFHFPDGSIKPRPPDEYQFAGPRWLGHWTINEQFYRKLCVHLSRAEGRALDPLLEQAPNRESDQVVPLPRPNDDKQEPVREP